MTSNPKVQTPADQRAGQAQDSTTIPNPETKKILSKPPQVHVMLQGKGGVGKSLGSALIGQWHKAKGLPFAMFDTDPVNATLAGYKALPVTRLELLDDDKRLDIRRFDQLMEAIVAENRHIVVDNGAASFLPLSNYFVENSVPEFLASQGRELVIHSTVTGGQSMLDTLSGLSSLCTQMQNEAKIVVWLNDFFGPVKADGKEFEDMRVYADNRNRIHGIVRIGRYSSDTFGRDFRELLDNRLTFAEIPSSPLFGLMPRQRLAMIQRDIFEQLDAVL